MQNDIYIIGPSHIHSDFTSRSDYENYYSNITLDPYRGLPVWSSRILIALREQLDKNPNIKLVWLVSDWKLNNIDYNKIIKLKPDDYLFLDVLGCPNNISRDYMSPLHIETLSKHGIKCISYILEQIPQLKLIFWCLYKRTHANKSSYPEYAQLAPPATPNRY